MSLKNSGERIDCLINGVGTGDYISKVRLLPHTIITIDSTWTKEIYIKNKNLRFQKYRKTFFIISELYSTGFHCRKGDHASYFKQGRI